MQVYSHVGLLESLFYRKGQGDRRGQGDREGRPYHILSQGDREGRPYPGPIPIQGGQA
jgi:hypothetical protein